MNEINGYAKHFSIVDEQEVTCQQLIKKSKYCENLLKQLSEPHANIGIYVPNSTQYITWLYACYMTGKIAVPIFYGASLAEVSNTIKACDLQVLVYMPPIDANCIMTECEQGISLINCMTMEVVSNHKPLIPSKAKRDTVLMISTSGSVDHPKRVMLSKENLVSNASDIIRSLEYDSSDVFLSVLPLCFASANTSQLLSAFLLGAKIVPYHGILHPAIIADYIKRYNVTSITVTPSLFKLMTESPVFTTKNLPSLKTICFGGGPSDTATVEKAAVKFKTLNLTQMYGQTETSARISHMRLNKDPWIPASVGKPIGEMQVRIADTLGNELPVGTQGRIQVKGKSVFSGYYRQPELTDHTFIHGWLNTGDIGKLDAFGNIYITGREKNLIIYCGFNIYPEEIESVLSSVSMVEDALVYGVPDQNYGECIIADVKLKEDAKIDIDELLQRCREKLPKHKIPSKINIVESIHKTFNGKKVRLKI